MHDGALCTEMYQPSNTQPASKDAALARACAASWGDEGVVLVGTGAGLRAMQGSTKKQKELQAALEVLASPSGAVEPVSADAAEPATQVRQRGRGLWKCAQHGTCSSHGPRSPEGTVGFWDALFFCTRSLWSLIIMN